MDITVTTEKVTPAKAEKWLNLNKSNRSLREGKVEQYASDMKNGRWTRCTVPIVFYDDGDIADGQHRLYAISESQTTQTFEVMRGLDRASGLNIDTGLSRSIVDNARISGTDTHLNNKLVGVVRGFAIGAPGGVVWSMSSTVEMIDRYREPCAWACINGPKKQYLCGKVVLSAIARAYAHNVDKDKLKRFCDVLATGYSQGVNESAAVSLRNYILSKGPLASATSEFVDTFKKVQNSISYFVRGKPLMQIKKVTEEIYPLRDKTVMAMVKATKAAKVRSVQRKRAEMRAAA